MSKKKDYTKYSKPAEPKNEEIEEVLDEETEFYVKPSKEPVYGDVCNCSSLNVRKYPERNAEVICTISYPSEVMITDESDEVFYKVFTASGIEGYCMKDYIKLR